MCMQTLLSKINTLNNILSHTCSEISKMTTLVQFIEPLLAYREFFIPRVICFLCNLVLRGKITNILIN